MRRFVAGFLMTGLLAIGLSVHERREARIRGEVTAPVIATDDGTGFPYPYPTPTPKPTK